VLEDIEVKWMAKVTKIRKKSPHERRKETVKLTADEEAMRKILEDIYVCEASLLHQRRRSKVSMDDDTYLNAPFHPSTYGIEILEGPLTCSEARPTFLMSSLSALREPPHSAPDSYLPQSPEALMDVIPDGGERIPVAVEQVNRTGDFAAEPTISGS
jgi:hypothetical protein